MLALTALSWWPRSDAGAQPVATAAQPQPQDTSRLLELLGTLPTPAEQTPVEQPPGEQPQPEATSGVPVALAVPELGIEASVDAVGTDPTGALALPPEPTRLGWYGAGARPGGPEGSAVIAGHLDRPGGQLGPLAELSRARPGTQIVVTDDTGATRTFQIRSLQVVPREELHVANPFRTDGEAVLTLITCTGRFDRDRGVYPENLVVTAVPHG